MKKNDDDDIQEYIRPCTNCDYHKKQAQFWLEEAYKQAGHPLPKREWVGLTPKDTFEIGERLGLSDIAWVDLMQAIEAKLKEKNT